MIFIYLFKFIFEICDLQFKDIVKYLIIIIIIIIYIFFFVALWVFFSTAQVILQLYLLVCLFICQFRISECYRSFTIRILVSGSFKALVYWGSCEFESQVRQQLLMGEWMYSTIFHPQYHDFEQGTEAPTAPRAPQHKCLPTAPGVCSRCVCVRCCVCAHRMG